MNKSTALIASAMMLTSYTAAADTLFGVYAGAQGWDMAAEGSYGYQDEELNYRFEDETQSRFYIALEHPIPVIPNIKIAQSEISTCGFQSSDASSSSSADCSESEIDFNYTDYTLYYEIFDNGLFSFDLGVTAKDFEGDFIASNSFGFNESVDEIIPMLYVAAEVGIPATGLSVFAEGNFLSIDDSTLSDYQVGVAYALIDNMLIDVNLSAGYRVVSLELDDLDDVYADLEFDGAFAGVEVHF
ncbi:TIGR04219 family outer membrane beta-barrel protein [Colwelliaceae bacterium BS250]